MMEKIQQIQPIRNKERKIHVNITTVNEHVGEIERSIRTVKEMVRSTVQGLPYC